MPQEPLTKLQTNTYMHFFQILLLCFFLYYFCTFLDPFWMALGCSLGRLWRPGCPKTPSNITENYRYARFQKSHVCNCPVLFLYIFGFVLGGFGPLFGSFVASRESQEPHMLSYVLGCRVDSRVYIYIHTSILSFYGILHFL